eukprot:373882-Pyramimonas_sp.AAC.1
MSDGGSEFESVFQRALENIGVYHHVCDAESPHQNGRCERHGGLVKTALAKAMKAASVLNQEELEDLLGEVVSAKNRFSNRGGYSPYQMVFGGNPRMPQRLLSDDAVDEVGFQDLALGTRDLESPSAAFARRHVLREEARRAVMSLDVAERLKFASKARRRADVVFRPGTWVCVWRGPG